MRMGNGKRYGSLVHKSFEVNESLVKAKSRSAGNGDPCADLFVLFAAAKEARGRENGTRGAGES